MIAEIDFNLDSDNNFCLVLAIQTDNDVALTHMKGIKLDADPIKTLVKLCKSSPIRIEFGNVIGIASDESIAAAQADAASKSAISEDASGGPAIPTTTTTTTTIEIE